MSLFLWNTNALALAIAEQKISPLEKFHYLLCNYCMYAASGYIGWLFITPSSGWLFWYEGFLVLIVTYFGLLRCRDRYEGAPDDRLLENCIMLGVPLGLKLILFTWLAHASIEWGIQWLISNLTLTAESPIEIISFLLKAVHKFYAFLIMAIGSMAYYLRLSTHLETISRRLTTDPIRQA